MPTYTESQARKGYCIAAVHERGRGVSFYQCRRRIKVWRKGKGYCSFHDPQRLVSEQDRREKELKSIKALNEQRDAADDAMREAHRDLHNELLNEHSRERDLREVLERLTTVLQTRRDIQVAREAELKRLDSVPNLRLSFYDRHGRYR